MPDAVRRALSTIAIAESPFRVAAKPPATTTDHRLAMTYAVSVRPLQGRSQTPEFLRSAYPNVEHQQQDAHEFLLQMLADASQVSALMTSWDRPLLRCRHCGADLALEAEQHSLISVDILDEMGQGRSLQEAVDAWTRPGILQDGYAWTCPAETCRSTEAPTKEHTLRHRSWACT